nr:unnamed protein product [Callosobruchus analis]
MDYKIYPHFVERAWEIEECTPEHVSPSVAKKTCSIGEDLKTMEDLRDTYAKYANWQWSNQMEFLRPFLGFAQTESNIGNIGEQEIAIEGQATEDSATSDLQENELEELYSPLAATNHQSDTDTQSVVNTPSHTKSPTSTRTSTSSRHQYKQNQKKKRK